MDLVGIKDELAIEGNVITMGGARSAGDEDMLATDELHAIFVLNLDRVRIGKSCVAFEGSDVVAAELRFNHIHFAVHDRLGAGNQVPHADAVFDHVSASIKRALPKAAQVKNGFAQHLAGNRSRVNADTANRLLAVNDGNVLAKLGGADGAFLPGWTTADYDEIKFVGRHRGLAKAPSPERLIMYKKSGEDGGNQGQN